MMICFIILLIVLIIGYPFKIKWSFHINLLENVGFVVFKVLFIRLTCERFKLNSRGQIEVERERKEKRNKLLIQKYIYSLAKRVEVKNVDLFVDVGAENDAYFVSVLSGYIGASLSVVEALIINKYEKVKMYVFYIPNYEESKLECTGKIIVRFSLIDVAFAFIEALKSFIKQKK